MKDDRFLGWPFRYDLFVNYSHGVLDSRDVSNLKGWSQAFVRELENELRQHPKFSDLSIFVDLAYRPEQKADPLEPLTGQLREAIAAAGLLVILDVTRLLGVQVVRRRAGLVAGFPGQGRPRHRWSDRRRAHLADRGAMAVGLAGRTRPSSGRLPLSTI